MIVDVLVESGPRHNASAFADWTLAFVELVDLELAGPPTTGTKQLAFYLW